MKLRIASFKTPKLLKQIKFVVLLPLLVVLSCERDDICAAVTPTTPRLLVQFFDVSDQETLKSATRLTVYGEGLVTDESGNPIEPETSSSATLAFNSNEDGIELPLIIGTEGELTTTRYIFERDTNFRLDSDDTTQSNIDIVEITYIPQFEYVSRACGFKSIFTELRVEIIDDGNTWIEAVNFPGTTLNNITVENENATHVHLFH